MTDNLRNLALVLLAGLVLAGCASVYRVERCVNEGGQTVCSFAEIKTRREFPAGIEIRYDGEARTFIVSTPKVETDNSLEETVGVAVGAAVGAVMRQQQPRQ